MTGQFWNSWALWEKLCFVLAGGIVIAIFAGAIKLGYTHWRLRQYTSVAAKTKRMREEIPDTTAIRTPRIREVPFGIRAIESGIEVDGVWISRTNTSTPNSPNIPASSTLREPSPTKQVQPPARNVDSSDLSRLELPHLARGDRMNGLGGSRSSSDTSSFRFEQAVSADRLHKDCATSRAVPQGSSKYEPSRVYHQKRDGPHFIKHKPSLERLERHVPQLATTTSLKKVHGSHYHSKIVGRPSSQTQPSNNQKCYIPQGPDQAQAHHPDFGYEVALLKSIYPRRFPKDTSADIEPLARHRRSHAAEMGQLCAPGQYSEIDQEWSPWLPEENPQIGAGCQQADRRYSSLDRTDDPFATPRTSLLLEETPNEPPSFQSFVEFNPAAIHRQSAQTVDKNEAMELLEQVPTHLSVLQGTNVNQRLKRSQVVRKVNSGFEVLKAGTFNIPQQSSDIADLKPQLHQGTQTSSKRLVKKRPFETNRGSSYPPNLT